MKRASRLLILMVMLISSFATVSAQTPVADTGDPSAFGKGVGAPATFFDGRGNPIIELQVTGIESDWQDYDEYSAPDRGMIYIKIDVMFTNMTDRSEIVSPYSIMMIDSNGVAQSMVYISDVDGMLQDDVPLAGGETVEGSMVFAMFADLQPTVLLWQPDYSLYVIVYLGE